MTENEGIDLVLNWNNDREKTDLRTFVSGIYRPDPKAYFDYTGFYVTKTILRNELKLENGRKPGDIDVLIIPFCNDKIYFENPQFTKLKLFVQQEKILAEMQIH